MFIKWREANKPLSPQRKAELAPLRPAWATQSRSREIHRFYAYLAKSVRVEGKPRQKIIAYLGSIPADCMQGDEGAQWRAFWFKVYCSLALVHAPLSSYRRVLSELEKRVHGPQFSELREIVAAEWELYPKWKKDYEALSRAIEWADNAWAMG